MVKIYKNATFSAASITASEEFGGEIRQEVQYVSVMELKLAKYVTDTFKEVSVIGDYMTGRITSKFLYDNLEGTKYVSARGEQRHMSLLQSDFNDYYSELRENSFLLKDYEQLQKIFTGYRFNFYEICQIGIFLRIPPKELATLKNNKSIERQIKAYDNRVIEMSEEGISGNEIARRIGASSRTVRIILDRQKNKSYNKTDPSNTRKKCGPKPKDWKKFDDEYLLKVEDAIRIIYGVGDARPHKVTVFAVSKILGLPDKAIYRMPKCLAKIKSYEESQEDYWRREVLWAIRTTKAAKREVNWRRIRELTNLRRSQFEALNISIDSL
ncbi:MAG: hypothetical protein IJF03_00045 [Lachnospiraceae bacterium]|nr:hypothetical protein [Lachnospiraceae bacterium]